MRGDNYCMIVFADRGVGLADAQRWLTEAGVPARESFDFIEVDTPDVCLFRVSLEKDDRAQRHIRAMAATRPDLEVPESASALFFVAARDIERALEERATLASIQRALQRGTEGILWESWKSPNDPSGG